MRCMPVSPWYWRPRAASVNRCFTPSDEEVAWARRVLDAAASSNGAAMTVDGCMVDRPVILRAKAIVHAADERAGMSMREGRD